MTKKDLVKIKKYLKKEFSYPAFDSAVVDFFYLLEFLETLLDND